jgi:tetratricopeptide (TPR) repeat protein
VAALQRATALCDLKRYADAAAVLGGVVASEPDNSRAWCLMARARLGDRRYDAAIEAASRAAAIDPEYEWPHRLLSIAARSQGDGRRAVTHAEEAARLAPHEWRTHLELAHARIAADDAGGASLAASSALELAPDQPASHLAAAAAASAAGRRSDARDSVRRALELDPDNSAAHDMLARLHVSRRGLANANPGRLSFAAASFAAAVRADPRSERSRRALDAVLRLFLRLVAYFVFLDAWLGYGLRSASPGIARVLPAALVVVPVGFAAYFVVRLPRELRPHLLRHAFSAGHAVATVLDVVAVALLIALLWAPHRTTFIGVAALAAIGARVWLWAWAKLAAR